MQSECSRCVVRTTLDVCRISTGNVASLFSVRYRYFTPCTDRWISVISSNLKLELRLSDLCCSNNNNGYESKEKGVRIAIFLSYIQVLATYYTDKTTAPHRVCIYLSLVGACIATDVGVLSSILV